MNLDNRLLEQEKTKINIISVWQNAAGLYNTLPAIYFHDYDNITDEENEEMDKKHDPSNLFLKIYKCGKWYKKDKKT